MSAPPHKNDPISDPSSTNPSMDEVAPVEESSSAASSAGVDEQIQKLQAEKKQLQEQLLRQQAEMENFRRRTAREKNEFLQFTLFDTVRSLLPILDGFELAMNSEGTLEDYRKGVELIHQQFRGALQKLGLQQVETKGQQFNPQMHEAIATVETDQHQDHEILEELLRGYYFKDRLLRPAMVKVATRAAGQSDADENATPE